MSALRLALLAALAAAACSGPAEVRWENASGDTLLEVTGSQGHCGWEPVSFLYFGRHRFVADPEGVLEPEDVTVAYDPSAELPAGAQFTGYRDGGRELWAVPGDPEAVYVVEDGRVERRPEIRVGCA